MHIAFIILQALAVPALAPLFTGIVRRLKARLQNRSGASVFQPYRDLWKLFHKDEVISVDASWITRFSPYLIFAITVLVGMSVPVMTAIPLSFDGSGLPTLPFLISGDFIVIIYLLALGTFFLALSGMDAGSGFGGFGASREMTVAALAEGGLFFSLLVASIASESGNVMLMIERLQALPFQSFMPLFIAFLAFVIALLAENGRFPVDNPATHLELTMIHEAMILEYSGKRLALMEWAAWNKLVIFVALGVNIFFPWGVVTELSSALAGAIVLSALLFAGKAGILLASIALIESTMAKFRIFRIPDLLFTSFVLGVIALGVIITL
jgi:formate hydrogenlyase subunit 4